MGPYSTFGSALLYRAQFNKSEAALPPWRSGWLLDRSRSLWLSTNEPELACLFKSDTLKAAPELFAHTRQELKLSWASILTSRTP